MLTSIKLGNFKAFGPTQTIPIKPITLIFGPNSAGKSSIIHSLLLAHQAAVVDGNLDVRCPKIAGNSVDLGGFEDYIHRHVITQPVHWQAEFLTGKLQGRSAEFLKQNFKTLEVALEFGVRTVESKEMKRRINPKTGLEERIPVPTGNYEREGKPFMKRYEIRLDGKVLIGLEARQPGVLSISFFDVRHPHINRNLRESFSGESAVPGLEKVTDEELEQAAREMLDAMSARTDQLVPECVGKRGMENMETHVYHAPAEVLFHGSAFTYTRLVRSVCVQFLDVVNGLLEAAYTAVNGALASMHYLGPLRTVPPRNFNHYEAHDPNWYSGGAYAWQVARENPEVRKKVNEWLSGRGRLTPGYTLELLRYFSPQSLREPLTATADDLTVWVRQQVRRATKDILAQSSLPKEEQDELLRQIRINPEAEPDSLNNNPDGQALHGEWQEKDPSKQRVEDLLERLNATGGDMNSLALVDQGNQTVVSHRDVGTGISQVFPVLVSAFEGKERLVVIEQPEIHIHPKLQADLGDVFIEAALAENGSRHKFLIETHSEHLILRLLRRVRESCSSDQFDVPLESDEKPDVSLRPEIRPEDICVLYVIPKETGAEVIELAVTEDGDFKTNWPHGFFTDRAEELF
jgi:hypothetical protein